MDAWQAGLTLHERQALLGAGPPGAAAGPRWQRWRSQPPFADDQWWQLRWEQAGIAPATLERLLDPPRLDVAPPVWLSTFQSCYAAAAWQPLAWLSAPSLLEALLPLLNWALQTVRQRCRDWIARPVAFEWEPMLVALHSQLGQRLAQLAAPMLALELNIARVRGDLRGADAEARFDDFVRRFPGHAAALLLKYPVLARLLVEEATDWIAAVATLVTRLQQDWPQIAATFGPASAAGACVEVRLGAGDSHNGQSVSMLRFASGWQLVYKPRSLGCEQRFQELLAWHNTVVGGCDLPIIALLERETYGWMEYIQPAPCPDQAAAERFYRRQGHYLALLYVLEASDIHYENIVAAGEYPCLIDLEGLCQPRLTEAQQQAPASVRRTGLLPLQLWSHGEYGGVDLSGLGGAANQALPGLQARWQDFNRDTMGLGYGPARTDAALNRPALDDQPLQAARFVEHLVAGFASTYQALLAHQARLEDTILAGFATALVRVIARPTQSYAIILRHSLHPNVCRDAADRERILDYLWMAVPQEPWLQALVGAEQRALWHNDVPWFGTRPRSRTLHTAAGEQLVDALPRPGWDGVRQRISQLAPADCEAQIAQIRAALAPQP